MEDEVLCPGQCVPLLPFSLRETHLSNKVLDFLLNLLNLSRHDGRLLIVKRSGSWWSLDRVIAMTLSKGECKKRGGGKRKKGEDAKSEMEGHEKLAAPL